MEPYNGYVVSAQPHAHADGTFSAYGIVSLRQKILTSSGSFEVYSTELESIREALAWARKWIDDHG
jgi:hypothetical protein